MSASPLVTVCVPAYRAARFLPQTLNSILEQTFADFRVRVAIEPDGADETLAACAEFADDDRFELVVNEATQGWPGNVRHLLHQVDTPLFAILPHDDLWHPHYLAALVRLLADRPDAVAAFPDTYLFRRPAGIRTIDLPDGPVAQQLLAYFVNGAHAYPWRGLARKQVLVEEFPDSEYRGFAADCEWAAHLILAGRVLRHAEPLYLKRQWPDDDQESVSVGWRFATDLETIRAAVGLHRQRLMTLVERAELPPATAAPIILAAETTMLIRWVNFIGARFDLPADLEAEVYRFVALLENRADALAGTLLSRLLFSRSRHLLQRHDEARAWVYAKRAVDADPDHAQAMIHFARLLLGRGRPADALLSVQRAAAAAPMAVGLSALQIDCARQLVTAYPMDVKRP